MKKLTRLFAVFFTAAFVTSVLFVTGCSTSKVQSKSKGNAHISIYRAIIFHCQDAIKKTYVMIHAAPPVLEALCILPSERCA